MAGAVVQHVETQFSAASGAGTVAKPASGNTLVVFTDADITQTVPTDNGSNTGWNALTPVNDGNFAGAWYRLATATDASSLTTVTYHSSGSTNPVVSSFIEISGCISGSTPFDKYGSATATGSTTTTTPTLTAIVNTGTDGDFVLAWAALHAATGETGPSWTNSFVNVTLSPNTQGSGTSAVAAFLGTLNQAVAASITTQCSWTNGAPDRQILIVSFKLAAAGAAAAIPDIFMGPMGG